jgi:8-oxo-dGDP phosphatase
MTIRGVWPGQVDVELPDGERFWHHVVRAGRVEHLATFQPMVGMADSEHVVFAGHDPERIAGPVEANEIQRIEWIPLTSVPALISSGEIWNPGSLVALLRLLADGF